MQYELESDLNLLRSEVESFDDIRGELNVLADAFQVCVSVCVCV